MNPYPLVGLNHFTVPVAISISLACAQVGDPASTARYARIRVLENDLRAAQTGAWQGRPKTWRIQLYDLRARPVNARPKSIVALSRTKHALMEQAPGADGFQSKILSSCATRTRVAGRRPPPNTGTSSQ